MKVKTSELTNLALDWAVAKALGCEVVMFRDHFRKIAAGAWDEERLAKRLETMSNFVCYIDTVGNAQPIPTYHKDGAQAVLTLHREKLLVRPEPDDEWSSWKHGAREPHYSRGSTPIIAIWRCFVAYKLGDEVDVPEELV